MKQTGGKSKRSLLSFSRTVGILVLCCVCAVMVLQMEMEKRNEESALESLPVFARQSAADVEGAVADLSASLHTAAEMIAASDRSERLNTLMFLESLDRSSRFLQTGIRREDDSALFSDGTVSRDEVWTDVTDTRAGQTQYRMGRILQRRIGDQEMWTLRLYVGIPGTREQLFGTVRVEDLFRRSFLYGLQGGDRHVIVFEAETGAILLDTLHDQKTLGENFYDLSLLTPEQTTGEPLETGKIPYVYRDGERIYLYADHSGVPGWELCTAVREQAVGASMGLGIPSALAYGLLILLFGVASVAVLLYQSMKERLVRDRLDQEVARRNFLMNAALPGSDTQLFEVLPDGTLRLMAPRQGQGQVLRSMVTTPAKLLEELNCSAQWEYALDAVMEQATAGQDSEMEIQTMDLRETWIQIRLEPMPDDDSAVAIGTIRDVTQQVLERNRQEAQNKLLDRMMGNTITGIEITLETDGWRMLWGRENYGALFQQSEEIQSFRELVRKTILPTIHPVDRPAFRQMVDPSSLLSSFRSNTRQTMDYRVLEDQGTVWHTLELYLFRDPVTHQAKANLFVRRVTRERMEELEEKRRLEEKERQLFLQAKRLVESEEELDFVQVIGDYYQGIYVMDLKRNETRSIKVPDYFRRILDESEYQADQVLERYSEEQLEPRFVAAFRALTGFDNLRNRLRRRGKAEMLFQKKDGAWIQMRVFPMPGWSEDNPVTLWVFEDETVTVNLRQEEEKARVQAQAAEAASQAKSQFLANMSHEIRTPLNAILGLSEMALREKDGREKDACLRDIRNSGRNLLEDINGILDLSKIEEGKLELDPEEYSILSMLHDVVTVLRLRAREKKLTFVTRIRENIPRLLYGDDVQISHIIMNLGSNAVKYTAAGSVTLTVDWEPRGEEGDLVIHLVDTGVGIRQEDMPYLFRSYGRLDRRANRHIEGTGLGLSIVQNLTEMMGGRVSVESEYGQGSDFMVRLPQKVADPAPCGPYLESRYREEAGFRCSFAAPEAVVLVVDDQPINLKICQGLLQPYEMEVYTARSGAEAIRRMTEVWPDLVFMDHMMPEMDGVETTARIRAMGEKDPYFAVVPIVALTANAMKGMRAFFLQNGFNDYVSKPVETDLLDRVLAEWIPADKQRPPESAAAVQTPEPVPKELLSVPGLDAEEGMAFCGQAEVYRQTLEMFRRQMGQRRADLRGALDEDRREDYIREAHSLKSAARWVGARALGERAEGLEKAGRDGRWEQVRRETPGLLADCARLEEALTRAVG